MAQKKAQKKRKKPTPTQAPSTVFVVKVEYESGSESGSSNEDMVEILGAYLRRETADLVVSAWQLDHGCDVDEDFDWSGFWCPVCRWGADWVEVQLHERA